MVAAGGTAIALLATVSGPIPLLIILAKLAGMVRGDITLLERAATTDRWGTTHYGLLAAPTTLASALTSSPEPPSQAPSAATPSSSWL